MNILKNTSIESTFRKIIIALVTLKFAVIFVASFVQMPSPHLHRQLDTFGVVIRYYQKFFLEDTTWHSLLPSVIYSGDTNGIMPMEFPFLNIFLSPFMLVPVENKMPFIVLVYLLITALLYYFCFKSWENKKIGSVSMSKVMAFLPVSSLFTIYSGKMIADVWGVLFIIIAMGYSWERRPALREIVLASLAILLKPVLTVAFGLLLFKDIKEVIFKYWTIWLIPTIVGLLYYTLGVEYLESVGSRGVFAIEFRGLSSGLIAFFKAGESFARLWNDVFFVRFGSIPLTLYLLFKFYKKDMFILRAVGILALQILTIGFLGGKPVYAHSYYCLSVVPVVLVIVFSIAEELPRKLWIFLLIVLFARQMESIFSDMKPLISDKKTAWRVKRQCLQARKDLPNLPWGEAKLFRSKIERFPVLDTCFLERGGSKVARYGYFYNDYPTPQCNTLKAYKDIKVVECN